MDKPLKQPVQALGTQTNGVSEYHRDTRAGFILPLAPVHMNEITPTMRKELDESSKYRNSHTSRIQRCLQTQVISFFKGPGSSLPLYQPDHSKIIDLGKLQLIDKPKSVREWTKTGWAFRWDTESIRLQLNYDKKTAATIDLEEIIYNFFVKLRFVWVPTTTAVNQTEIARIDLFLNFNSPKTIRSLDAAYFNINGQWIDDLLNNEKSTVLYHRRILSKLRSESAQQIASLIIADIDLSSSSPIKTTTMQTKQSYVNQLYQGEKKLEASDPSIRLRWAAFVQDCINRNIKKVCEAFGFKTLKFVTNGRRGTDMLAWFEYSWSDGSTAYPAPSAVVVAYPKDIPELAHPDLFSQAEVARYHTSVNVKEHFSWDEVLLLQAFIDEMYHMLDSIGLERSVMNNVVVAYSPNASKQIPKTVKRWITPIKTWVKNRKELFSSIDSEPKDEIDFDSTVQSVALSSASSVADKQNKSKAKKVANKAIFDSGVVNAKVRETIRKMVQIRASEFETEYPEELDDFIDWNIPIFTAYHINNSGFDHKETVASWQKKFSGWVNNAINETKIVKDFRSVKFSVSLLTKTSPFDAWIASCPANVTMVIHRSLEVFEITYANDRKTIAAWQRQAWSWLREERSLHALNVKLHDIRVGQKKKD